MPRREAFTLSESGEWSLVPGAFTCVTRVDQFRLPNGGLRVVIHRTPLWRVLLRALFQPSSWDNRFSL